MRRGGIAAAEEAASPTGTSIAAEASNGLADGEGGQRAGERRRGGRDATAEDGFRREKAPARGEWTPATGGRASPPPVLARRGDPGRGELRRCRRSLDDAPSERGPQGEAASSPPRWPPSCATRPPVTRRVRDPPGARRGRGGRRAAPGRAALVDAGTTARWGRGRVEGFDFGRLLAPDADDCVLLYCFLKRRAGNKLSS